MNEVKVAGDVVAGGITIGTLAGWLPHVAALISIVYGILRIYEWFEKRRGNH